ncbi:hypothetical protein cypCar_00042770 [Cyprinus carpio]|nr:hypothetical protein cypCar_00042770 [Cyprinus carpio]
MTLYVVLYLLNIFSASHTLTTTYTGVNRQTVAGIPEFSSVTVFDGRQIDYYDSKIKKLITKQNWMKEFASTETWKEYTEIRERFQQTNHFLMKQFNHSHGVHRYQRVYGCGWDYVTGHIYGFDEYSYDGQDFIILDLEELRYIASVPQAQSTVMKWNNDREQLVYLKRYYRDKCTDWIYFLTSRKDDFERREWHIFPTLYTEINGETIAGFPEFSAVATLDGQQIDYYDSEIKKLIPKQDWMKKFASGDRERVQQINKLNIPVLMQRFNQSRAPEVSLLHKDPFSPVVCHATGFYPSAVTITWLRNGEDHDEDVELGELLPNEDGTFQKTSTLRVPPDEWKKDQYVCVVKHETETIQKILRENEIKSNDIMKYELAVGPNEKQTKIFEEFPPFICMSPRFQSSWETSGPKHVSVLNNIHKDVINLHQL